MDYKQKYLKYKNKYLQLKNQLGGDKNIKFNACKHIDIRTLVDGEKINIEPDPIIRNKEIEFILNIENGEFKFVSVDKVIDLSDNIEKPILNIKYYFKDDRLIGKLVFVRVSDNLSFDQLFDIFLCLSKYVNASIIELEDDARFFDKSGSRQSYSAYKFRLFQGKKSLYINKGFKPILLNVNKLTPEYLLGREYKEVDYDNDIYFLSNITFGQLISFFNNVYDNTFYKTENDFNTFFIHDRNINEKLNIKFGQYLHNISKSNINDSYVYIHNLLNILERQDFVNKYAYIVVDDISVPDVTVKEIHYAYKRIIKATDNLYNDNYVCKTCT